MSQQKTLEEIVVEQADVVRHQIEEAADFAESEMDLQVEVAKALDHFSSVAHLPKLRAHHNITIGEGRPDSVYGCVFVEYKTPGRLTEDNKSPGNKELIKQLETRPKEFQKELKRDITELIGVGTDGRYFILARYRRGKWEIGQPQSLSSRVVERVLRYLVGLGTAGKPFQPDYLAGDFGAESDRKLARDGIGTLYARVREIEQRPDDFPKGKVLFDQWRILFGEVCGYDVNKLSPKIKELADFYGVHKNPNAAALLFAVHSYYALFMKFLAAEIATTFNPLSASFLQRLHQTGSSKRLQEELRELEDGGIYRQLGIKNFLEGDLFSWYLDAWDDRVEKTVRDMVACFDEYDAKTLVVEPDETRDLLKKLYQQLFPKTVRHDLGEYYTPDWLAELVMERVGYTGDPDKRVLDPACGSGTFLVIAINKIREYAAERTIPKHELLPKILANVVGFDLNPLAVMAARTNYLLALRDMLKLGGEIEIPVYLCDSITTPVEYGGLFAGALPSAKELKTAAASFIIPTDVATDRGVLARYADQVEFCVRHGYSAEEFIERCVSEDLPIKLRQLHTKLYDQLVKLAKARKNGIWARIIKNAFAPLFVGRVEYVLGNPPWINWESLPEEYRRTTLPLWDRYGLRQEKGQLDRMRSGKRDVAMLFVYGAADNYLVDEGGRLGFVITQTVFKTTGAGDGFRRFRYAAAAGKVFYLRPTGVVDMSDLQPFEEATNRTAVLVCEKSVKAFSYPVPYERWDKVRRTQVLRKIDSKSSRTETPSLFSFTAGDDLKAVRAHVDVTELVAVPVSREIETSPWLTVQADLLPAIGRVLGESHYKAREGVNTGGLNGCYWVQIVKALKGGHVLIENLWDVGKIKVERCSMTVEPDLVYPLLRGRDVRRWRAVPSACLLAPQDPKRQREGIPEADMKQRYPKTFSYLKKFEKQLAARPDRKYYPEGAPFYTMRNVGSYALSPWKVVWREQASQLTAAVVGSEAQRPVLPDHKCMYVPFASSREAHYLCALLNSAMVREVVAAYVVQTSTSTHVLEHVAVPKFDGTNRAHVELGRLSARAHGLKATDPEADAQEIEAQIEELAAAVWS